TVRTALLGRRSDSDVVLPSRPLGAMHGEAAARTLAGAGAVVRVGERVDDLDDVDADTIVVALPPRESARLLGEGAAQPEGSRFVPGPPPCDRARARGVRTSCAQARGRTPAGRRRWRARSGQAAPLRVCCPM